MPIKVGDRFMETIRPNRVWEVVRVVSTPNRRPHASLRLSGDPRESRLLSCAVLEDHGRYKKLADVPPPPGPMLDQRPSA